MEVFIEEVAIEIPESRVPRTPGLHLSAVIRDMAIQGGGLPGEILEEMGLLDARMITDPVAILRICMGLAWEEWYIPQLKDVIDHPGEMQLDGIYLTPDAESVDYVFKQTRVLSVVIHEVKCTYKSTRTVGELKTQKELFKQWLWLAQLKAYCKAAGTCHAVLHVLFVCGDYSYPIRPILKVFKIEFTQEELDDNWNLLQEYVKYRTEGDEE